MITAVFLNKSMSLSNSLELSNLHTSFPNKSAIKQESVDSEYANVKSEFSIYNDEASTSNADVENPVLSNESNASLARKKKAIKNEVIETWSTEYGETDEPAIKRMKLPPYVASLPPTIVYLQNDVKKSQQSSPLRRNYIPSSVNALKPDRYEIVHVRSVGAYPIIFCSKDKTLCYGFSLPTESTCTCLGCIEAIQKYAAKLGNSKPATISMIKNAHGQINISLKNVHHNCKPQKYSEVLSFVRNYRPKTLPSTRIVTSSYYQIQILLNGKKRLTIFDKFDQSKCYNYFNCGTTNHFICLGCQKKKKSISATICLDDNGEEYVHAKTDHLCQPLKYEEYKTLKILDFEVCSNDTGESQLIVFDSNDRKLCRRYSWNPKKMCYFCPACTRAATWILAKVCEDESGVKFVEVEAVSHVCSPVEYVGRIKSSDFELRVSENGRPKIIQFYQNDKSQCYRLSYCKNDKSYSCPACRFRKKRVTTKIWKDENGEEFIQPTSTHVCNPIPLNN